MAVVDREQVLGSAEQTMSEEEREHRRLMSERMRALLEGSDERTSAPVGAYEYTAPLRSEHVPAYQQGAFSMNEHHAPVVPTSPNAPSAAQRLADYIPVTVGMQSLQRMGDMPASRVTDYAPAYTPAYAPAPDETAAPAHAKLFESLLYKDGELIDSAVEAPVREETYAPAREEVYAPEYDPSYVPLAEGGETAEEEDALPTRKTMESIEQHTENKSHNVFVTALSTRAKLVLLAVTAVILLLFAVICVNTAIINSLDKDIAAREEELVRLSGTMESIEDEIGNLTAPENIESWALEHGMSR